MVQYNTYSARVTFFILDQPLPAAAAAVTIGDTSYELLSTSSDNMSHGWLAGLLEATLLDDAILHHNDIILHHNVDIINHMILLTFTTKQTLSTTWSW